MRVAARTKTQSRRLSWGAGLVGAGLTATVAFGIAAGSAAAHTVPRVTMACKSSCPTTGTSGCSSCQTTPPTSGCAACATKPPTSGCTPCQTAPPPPPACPSGATGFSVTNPVSGPVAIPGDGNLQLTIHNGTQGETFDFDVPAAAHRTVVQVTATGSAGAKVYTYDSTTGFPDGKAADTGLHSTANSAGQDPVITRIDFCVKPTKYV